MRILIAGLLSAVLLHLVGSPAHLNNVNSAPKRQQVQAETQRNVSTAISQEKAQTEPEAISQPEQGCDGYRNLFSQYDWSVSTAIAICKAESGGNADAISTTCDRGLMQINCVHADMVGGDLTKLYDPTTNIQVAWKIYSARGWSAWTTWNTGRYLAFL